MRDDMAKVLSTHSDVVHHSAGSLADDENDPRLLDRKQLLEVSKQVSRDQDAYGMLNEAMNREMIKDMHSDHPSDPRETLLRSGSTVGFLEEARYQALKTDKDDPSCAMEVDKRRELTFQASLVPADLDPLEVKRANLLRAGNPQKAATGSDARVADNGATAYDVCTYEGERHRYVVEVWVDKSPADVDRRREDLARFIAAYLPAALKAAGCTT